MEKPKKITSEPTPQTTGYNQAIDAYKAFLKHIIKEERSLTIGCLSRITFRLSNSQVEMYQKGVDDLAKALAKRIGKE